MEPLCDSEMSGPSKGFVPHNTQENSEWGMRVFLEWSGKRNKRTAGVECPADLFNQPIQIDELNYWLSRFVLI